ncbi:MAG: ribonuclease domain-containing protein [Eubacteriales bacterium]|nr:ribonuclease domain-containing protein [Eubacteriales bacterium]
MSRRYQRPFQPLIFLFFVIVFIIASGLFRDFFQTNPENKQETTSDLYSDEEIASLEAALEAQQLGKTEGSKIDLDEDQLKRIVDPDVRDALNTVEEDGEYRDYPHVAAYMIRFSDLPANYRSKEDSRQNPNAKTPQGDPYMIGGNHFGNHEGHLKREKGLKYHELDIEAPETHRGPKRLVYSNRGGIYYTEDHYDSFRTLVEDEE